MIQITRGGLTCYCDGYRADRSLAFLSLFGDHNAVRACWAHLVADRRKYRGLQVGDRYLQLADGVQYMTLRRPIGHQQLHLVMLRPDATTQVSPFGDGYTLIAADPARQFWPRFCRMCSVPMRAAWREPIWGLGLAHGAIEPLDGIGVPGYRVATDAETWQPLVAGALAFGGLA